MTSSNPHLSNPESRKSPPPDPTPNNISSPTSSPEIVRQKAHVPYKKREPPTLLPAFNVDPSVSFPYRPPPRDVTIRLQPLAPALSAMDERTKTLVPPAASSQYEKEKEKNARLLAHHVYSRTKYVQYAHWRLQAVLGERNGWEFEFWDKETPPPMYEYQLGTSIEVDNSSGLGARVIPKISLLKVALTANMSRNLDSDFENPLNAQPKVVHFDPKTGKGLKDWLFKFGKENGMTKKSLSSISFHDFTPDIMTGDFSNILLGHYTNRRPGCEVEVYELKLPTQTADPITHKFSITMEPWICFLISRTLASTIECKNSHGSSQGINVPGKGDMETSSFPPNFPNPMPTSWMLFTCPLSNVTSYPPVDGHRPPKTTPTPTPTRSFTYTSTSSSPHPPPTKRLRKSGKYISKRQDYDFSHQGVPKFEFSNMELDFLPKSIPMDGTAKRGCFLSADGVSCFRCPDTSIPRHPPPTSIPMYIWQGPCPVNPTVYNPLQTNILRQTQHFVGGQSQDQQQPAPSFHAMNKREYRQAFNSWQSELHSTILTAEEQKKDIRNHRFRDQEFPAPYHGSWWKDFYAEIYADETCWRRIRDSMARGKCRVVIRWKEWVEEDEEVDLGDLFTSDHDEVRRRVAFGFWDPRNILREGTPKRN